MLVLSRQAGGGRPSLNDPRELRRRAGLLTTVDLSQPVRPLAQPHTARSDLVPAP